jgi:hypothetical protein
MRGGPILQIRRPTCQSSVAHRSPSPTSSFKKSTMKLPPSGKHNSFLSSEPHADEASRGGRPTRPVMGHSRRCRVWSCTYPCPPFPGCDRNRAAMQHVVRGQELPCACPQPVLKMWCPGTVFFAGCRFAQGAVKITPAGPITCRINRAVSQTLR